MFRPYMAIIMFDYNLMGDLHIITQFTQFI